MSSPKLIKTWEELKECTSETHVLMIEVEDGNGWIYRKDVDPNKEYHTISRHTFYGGMHEHSTEILQKCGFDVVLANWDELGW